MSAFLHKLTREHASSCRAPEENCNCTPKERNKQEERPYWITSFLAVIAGVIGATVGYNVSLAVLADSLHAFSDGFADMWGIHVVRKIGKNPEREEELRRKGTRVIACMLLVAALLVLHEAWDRFENSGYTVSPIWILCVGLATSMIDFARVWILSLAQSHKPNEMRGALILHALLDLRRSETLVVIGILIYLGQVIAIWMSAAHIDSSLRGIDLFISVLLAGYMIIIAIMMWLGKHSHIHYDMRFEQWIIKKVLGIRLHLPHHHH